MVEASTSGPWERRPNELPAAYEAFRAFRDLAPSRRRLVAVLDLVEGSTERTLQTWAKRYDWWERAAAWDDVRYQTEDKERLDNIRDMVTSHREAARRAVVKAIASLEVLPNLPAGTAVRLLEFGTKLERQTLVTTVAELQGDDDDDDDDGFDRIARMMEDELARALESGDG